MKQLLIAISFFTRIPIRIRSEIELTSFYKSMMLLPIVGFLIGLILYFSVIFLKYINYLPIQTLILILIYFIITGGIHYDGVADSFDGLFSNKKNEDITQIMSDPNIGTFGTIALILFILSFFLINQYIISTKQNILLILYPTIGRLGAIELGAFYKPIKKEGLGYNFCKYDSPIVFLVYTAIVTVFILLLDDYNYLYSFGLVLIMTIFSGESYKRKINGITGDLLGLTIELDQILFILFYILLTSFKR